MDEVAVTSTSEGPAAEAAPAAGSADSPAGNPSEVKSFAYGALGIDPRAEQTSSQNPSYTAGQWTGAALKVGGIIALLV